MGELKAAPGADAVHLCLDMQKLFGVDGPWPTPWMERVLPTIVSIVEKAPSQTLFTRFMPPPSEDEAHGMWRAYYRKWGEVTRQRIDPDLLGLMPALQRYAPPARIFDKPVYSAFATGPFIANCGKAV